MNGLKKDLKGSAEVLQIDLTSEVGRAAARDYGVKVLPTTLLFDGEGQVVIKQEGIPDAGKFKAGVKELVAASP